MTASPTSPETQTTTQEVLYDLSQMRPWREFSVVLFDDEVHSQDEVVIQLMKALQCSLGRAHNLMRQAEQAGKTTVAITHREHAMRITEILRQIDLRVRLRQIN